jgi:hypothetical protein
MIRELVPSSASKVKVEQALPPANPNPIPFADHTAETCSARIQYDLDFLSTPSQLLEDDQRQAAVALPKLLMIRDLFQSVSVRKVAQAIPPANPNPIPFAGRTQPILQPLEYKKRQDPVVS